MIPISFIEKHFSWLIYGVLIFCYLFIDSLIGTPLLIFTGVFAFILVFFFYNQPQYPYFIFLTLSLFTYAFDGRLFFKEFDEESTGIAINRLADAAGFITLLLTIRKKPDLLRFKFYLLKQDILLILFIITLLFSSLNAYNPQLSFQNLLRFPSFILLYMLTRTFLKQKRDFIKLIKIGEVTLTVIMIFCFSKILTAERYGSIGNFIFFLPPVITYAFYKREKILNPLKASLPLILSAIISVAFLVTESRRMFGGVLLSWLLVGLFLKKFSLKQLTLVVLFGYATFQFFPDSLLDRYTRTFEIIKKVTIKKEAMDLSDKSAFFTRRDNLWQIGIEMFKDHPFFGVGLKNARLLTREYGESKKLRIHNIFLDILVDNGIFSLIVFIIILISFTLIGWHAKHIYKLQHEGLMSNLATSFTISLIATTSMAFFGGSIIYDKFGWLLFGILAALYIYSRRSFRIMQLKFKYRANSSGNRK